MSLLVITMIVLGLGVTHFLWAPWVLATFAENNFLITAKQEGTAKAIIHYGEFNRLTMAYRKRYFNSEWDVVIEGTDAAKLPENAPVKKHFMDDILPGGLAWVGLPFANRVYESHFQWTSIRQGTLKQGILEGGGLLSIVEQKDLEDLLISRDEIIDDILLKRDVYGITFQDINDVEMIPLSFIALLTGKIVNPYKALFGPEQWLEQTTNFLRSYVKEYIGQYKFAQLVSKKKETDEKGKSAQQESAEILGYLTADGRTVGNYIREEFGFDIEQLNLVNFKPSGKLGEAHEQAAARQYVAERDAEAIGVLATAEAGKITKIATAIKEAGESGTLIRTLEAYEALGEKGNATTIISEHPVQALINSAKPVQPVPAKTT